MNATPELVREVFARVLERQVFLFAEELAIEDIPPGGEWVEARMAFNGPFEGSLSLAMPKEVELEIAANFLGKEAGDPDVAKFAQDSLKEILNVVCGHMLTALAGEDPVFDLSIPKVHALSAGDWAALAALPDSLGFDMEGKPALLRFHLPGNEA
jgi:CheY-specific phosphatase CheX